VCNRSVSSNRSVSNGRIVSNVSSGVSDISIVSNVSIVGNVSIVRSLSSVKKKRKKERPILAGKGLLLASSLLHQPEIWPQHTAEHHYHAFISCFLVSHLHSLLHQNQQHI